MTQLHYFSTVRGFLEQRTGIATVYYGKTYRMQKDRWEELLKNGTKNLSRLEQNKIVPWLKDLDELQDNENITDDTIFELYEVRDSDNGDLLVMVRVPVCDPDGEPTSTPSWREPEEEPEAGEDFPHNSNIRAIVPTGGELPEEMLEVVMGYFAIQETGQTKAAANYIKKLSKLSGRLLRECNLKILGKMDRGELLQ